MLKCVFTTEFKYKIALPAPALFSQFKGLRDLSKIIDGLRRMGFDDVFEVARGAEVVSAALRKRLKEILRLFQSLLRFRRIRLRVIRLQIRRLCFLLRVLP